MNISQAKIATLESVGQARVVDAHLMQQCGVQVMNVNRVVHDVVTKIVRLPVNHSRSNSTPGQPHREAATVMVAAVVCKFQLALTVCGAAEFAAPHDKRFIQQSTLLEIAN